MGTPATPRRFAIALYDDMQLLDVVGPADVFVRANPRGGACEVMLVASRSRIRSAVGLHINGRAVPAILALTRTSPRSGWNDRDVAGMTNSWMPLPIHVSRQA